MQSVLRDKISGDSCWHALDARLKLLAVLVQLVLLAFLSPGQAVLALLVSLIFLGSTGIPFRQWWNHLLTVLGFLLLFVAVLPWTVGSADSYLGTSQKGTWLALGILCKGLSATAWILFLTGTTTMEQLFQALSQLGLPRPIQSVLMVTWHYLHVMYRAISDFRVALRLRGFRKRTSLQTYQTITHLIGTLLVQGYDRTERLVQAMHLRGYQGKIVSLQQGSIKTADWPYLLLLLLPSCLLYLFPYLYTQLLSGIGP
ncbi:MAG TPA: cobalt ECF transporter T component CbiQ, partial [Gemmatales bacterium]|nr:cobalt ECF transporter T component CbiQ [Gemmatales bacterium]